MGIEKMNMITTTTMTMMMTMDIMFFLCMMGKSWPQGNELLGSAISDTFRRSGGEARRAK
eukprot:748545-Hanusia_phi.AAC.3